jgi:hypothetical protein
MEQRWNDIDRGKPKNSDKNVSQRRFVHYKSHWIDRGMNPSQDVSYTEMSFTLRPVTMLPI